MSDPLAGARQSQGGSDPMAKARPPSRWTDLANTLLAAPRNIAEGIIGMPGDIEMLGRHGLGWVGEQTGALLPGMRSKLIEGQTLPTSTDIHERGVGSTLNLPPMEGRSDVQDLATTLDEGTNYQPQTDVGRIGQNVLENMVGGKKMIRDVLLPAVGTEAGGQVGEALGHETLGRLLGGVGFGAATTPVNAFKGMTVGQMSPNRAKLVKILTDANVPITGGQASGSKALKYLEAGPFEGRARNIADAQNRAYNRAVFKQAGIEADIASPDVLTNAYDSLGNEYDQIIARTGGIQLDPELQQNLLDAAVDFQRLKNTGGGIPQDIFDRAFAAADANGGIIPADVYKTISSDISRLMRASKDPETLLALSDIKDAFFDSITRGAGPEIAGEWKDLNRRYRNFQTIKDSMRGAGESTNVEGNIVPAKLRAAMQQRDKNFPMDQGELAELARAGTVLGDVPQSGTPGRNAFSLAGSTGVGGALAYWLTKDPWATAAAGMVSPFLQEGVGQVVASKPVRTSLIAASGLPPLPQAPTGQGAGWQTLLALQDRARELEEGRR